MGHFRRLSELSGQNLRERRAGSENGYCRSRPSTLKGKAAARGQPNDIDPWSCRSNGAGTQEEDSNATRETLPVTGATSQPDAREGQAGPGRESERLIVPRKPGNAGGGKGP